MDIRPFLENNFFVVMILAALWTLPWKGLALWKSARRGDNIWFMALLVINTLGILEILYIFVFSERNNRLDTSSR